MAPRLIAARAFRARKTFRPFLSSIDSLLADSRAIPPNPSDGRLTSTCARPACAGESGSNGKRGCDQFGGLAFVNERNAFGRRLLLLPFEIGRLRDAKALLEQLA